MQAVIYNFVGQQETLVKETFEKWSKTEVQIYVWKSENASLGFDTDTKSQDFLKTLISDKVTISVPSFELYSNDVRKKIFKGITFLDHTQLIKDTYQDYLDYLLKQKKNELLRRHNKEIVQLTPSQILNWYDKSKHKYTSDFFEFTNSNNISYIIWAFSEFGTYFFTFNDLSHIIKSSAKDLDIGFISVNDMLQMPYH